MFFESKHFKFIFLLSTILISLFLINFISGEVIFKEIKQCSNKIINPSTCYIDLDTDGANKVNGQNINLTKIIYNFNSNLKISIDSPIWIQGYIINDKVNTYKYNLNPSNAGKIKTKNFTITWNAEKDRKTKAIIKLNTSIDEINFDETKFTCVKNEDTSIISIFEMLPDGKYIYTTNETQKHFKKKGTDIFICVKNSKVPAPLITPEPMPLEPSDDVTTPTSSFNFKKFYNGLLEKLLKKKAP